MAAYNTRKGTDSTTDVLFAVVLGGLSAIIGGVWLWGQAAALLIHGAWLPVGFWQGMEIGRGVVADPADPAGAWPPTAQGQLPGPVAFYAIGAALLVALTAVMLPLVRWAVGRNRNDGFAPRRKLTAVLAVSAVLARGHVARPSLRRPWYKLRRGYALSDVGVRIGRSIPDNVELAASVEDSVIVMAAPRQGKTSQVVIPWLHRWPGPALVTTLRPDVLLATAALRRSHGPVAVMAPTGMSEWPDQVTWSPTSGCEDFDKALQRADLMVAIGKSGKSDANDGGFFSVTATNLLAGWLHAAAVSGRGMNDVVRWGLDERLDEPVRILRDHAAAAQGSAAMLDNIYRAPAETTRNNLWTTVQSAIAPLLSQRARRTFCPDPEDSVDLRRLLESRTTVYLMVDQKQAGALAPLITAFTDELVETAKQLADASPGGRLDPPLGMLLDEVANVCPLPDLPDLMSFSGGSGIFVAAILQSRAQAEARWGREGAAMLWGAATVKIALGGLAGTELHDLSELAGEYAQHRISHQRGAGGSSTQTSIETRRTITPEQIRTLNPEKREALVIHATTPAVKVRMVRHYEGPDRRAYRWAASEANRILESRSTSAAPHARVNLSKGAT